MNAIKTVDYGLFKTVLGNRVLNESHVKRLMDSIRIKNLLEKNPVIVNKNFDVIDGQHRLEAATRLETPIYYVVEDDASLKEVQLLNANSRAWHMEDYLESFISNGNKNYQILKDFKNHYGLNFSVAISLLADQSKTVTLLRAFREGNFEVIDLGKADEEAKALLSLKPYVEHNAWRGKDFVSAVKRVWDKIDPDVFLEKASKREEKFRRRNTVKDYLRDFEDTYNYGLKVNQIRFY